MGTHFEDGEYKESCFIIYNYDESRYVSSLTWDTEVHPYPKEWLEKTILWDFEDMKASVPVGYQKILEESYGDYMKLPSPEKRIQKHEYKIYKKGNGERA